MLKCPPLFRLDLLTRGESKKNKGQQIENPQFTVSPKMISKKKKTSIFRKSCFDLQKFGQLHIIFRTCPLFEHLVALIISFEKTCPPFWW